MRAFEGRGECAAVTGGQLFWGLKQDRTASYPDRQRFDAGIQNGMIMSLQRF